MTRESEHTCHAIACEAKVPPRMLMCAKHWRMVPRDAQAEVWATYQRGQERLDETSPRPTDAYLAAAQRAVDAVARKEGRQRGSLPGLG